MDDHNRCELEVDVIEVDRHGLPTTGTWICCLPCYWLKRSNSVHKASLTMVTLLVMVLLVMSPVLFLSSSMPGEKPKDCHFQENECSSQGQRDICDEDQCKAAANRILKPMSWKTDPCKDFYEFACGSWTKKADDPDLSFNFYALQGQIDRTVQQLLTVSANSEPFQKLGMFYQSCLNAGDKRISLVPMFSLLNELGGYLSPSVEEPKDLTPLIVRLLRVGGAPLMDVYLDLDLHNSSRFAPFIDLPIRFDFNTRFWRHSADKTVMSHLDEFSHHLTKIVQKREASNDSMKSEQNANKAYAFMKASLEEKRLLVMERLMFEFMPENMSVEAKTKETQSTLLFVSILTKLYPKEKEVAGRMIHDLYLETNLTLLQQQYPFIQWNYLLKHVFNYEYSTEEPIYMYAPKYMQKLKRTLPHFNNRVIHNGLLLIYATDTLNELLNTSSSSDWPKFCTKVSENVFSKAVSALYVRQYQPDYLDQLRMRVTLMFDTLKKTFESRVRKTTWLDDSTREAVLQKLSSLHGQFLTWPNFMNTTYVASLLQDVVVDPDDFFGNVIRRYKQLRTVPMNFQNQPSPEEKWAYPFVVNAFYVLTMNSIVIPLALLTQPYFRADVPRYIPYSTMGSIFAHEILHAFDSRGIGYDAYGGIGTAWTQESRLKLEAKLDCVIKQFSAAFWRKVYFMGTNFDVQFDWNMTKNENMADISGLQIAYQAWKTITSGKEATLPGINLNAQQLFFLNAAQTYCSMLSPAEYILQVELDIHTPHPERVNGIMMNSPDFAEAFKCPSGSPMNPKKKCTTW